VPEILAACLFDPTRHVTLSIVSGSSVSWATAYLDRVGYLDRFGQLACADEMSTVKPDPAVYLLALQRLSLFADEAIAFEDAPHGVAAAQSAGLRCVAVPNPHTDPTRFAAADLVLSSAADRPLSEVIGR
jgi:beta-phosphoglucomutase-like phosphatase (HAD superfamily)